MLSARCREPRPSQFSPRLQVRVISTSNIYNRQNIWRNVGIQLLPFERFDKSSDQFCVKTSLPGLSVADYNKVSSLLIPFKIYLYQPVNREYT